MYITFETPETYVSIQVDKRLQAYEDETLVYEACQQLGLDYEDYNQRESFARANVLNVNWQPIVNKFRQQNTTLKRQLKLGELTCKQAYAYCK